MERDFFDAWWLPPERVSSDPGTCPAAELRCQAANDRRQNQRRDCPVALPDIAHVTCHVRKAHPFAPIPFIRINARIELASKNRFEPGFEKFDEVRRK